MQRYYVYILTNKSHTTLYIGVTNDIKRRVMEHSYELNDGFTKKYRVTKLIYMEEYGSRNDAIAREKQLKGWTRRKKEMLIATQNPDWKELVLEL